MHDTDVYCCISVSAEDDVINEEINTKMNAVTEEPDIKKKKLAGEYTG